MTYLHVMNRGVMGVKSPIDRCEWIRASLAGNPAE
jgi:hypothetical protein